MKDIIKTDMEVKDFKCGCGNTSFIDGLFPCNSNGEVIEPTIENGWNGLYRCGRCGQIYNHINNA